MAGKPSRAPAQSVLGFSGPHPSRPHASNLQANQVAYLVLMACVELCVICASLGSLPDQPDPMRSLSFFLSFGLWDGQESHPGLLPSPCGATVDYTPLLHNDVQDFGDLHTI